MLYFLNAHHLSHSWASAVFVLCSTCVGCGWEVGTYFLLMTFLSLESWLYLYLCVCVFVNLWWLQGNPGQCSSHCFVLLSLLWGQHFSSTVSISSPHHHCHLHPYHPPFTAHRTSTQRKPEVTYSLDDSPTHWLRAFYCHSMLSSAVQPLSMLSSGLITSLVYCCIWSHFGPFPYAGSGLTSSLWPVGSVCHSKIVLYFPPGCLDLTSNMKKRDRTTMTVVLLWPLETSVPAWICFFGVSALFHFTKKKLDTCCDWLDSTFDSQSG